jgi:hypothetical protein
MQTAVLTDWSPAKAAGFGKQTVIGQHTLHQRPMFSDAGLADLLDRYPRAAFGIHTMGSKRADKDGFRKGTPGDLSGADLLEAVRRGRLWINLRNANAHLPEYAALCDEMFGELDAANGIKTMKRDVGVLISSPNARVFYHLDIPLVTLWQIKGEKTMYVYPRGGKFARDEQIEAIVLREREEEISYDPGFDADAETVHMTPGVVASWPQTAPHRIDNGNCLNVSLSCEFMTMASLVHANALYANGAMRRWWGVNPSIEADSAAAKAVKAAMARGFKLMNSRQSFEQKNAPTFVVDLSAENAVRDLSAA